MITVSWELLLFGIMTVTALIMVCGTIISTVLQPVSLDNEKLYGRQVFQILLHGAIQLSIIYGLIQLASLMIVDPNLYGFLVLYGVFSLLRLLVSWFAEAIAIRVVILPELLKKRKRTRQELVNKPKEDSNNQYFDV